MSEQNLSAMTVIELRKLAKELHVPLSAGISKQGIVERLTQAMAGTPADAPEEQEAAPAEVPAEPAGQEPESEPAPKPAAPAEAPAAPSFRQAYVSPRFNAKPAYQAPSYNSRPAAPRTPAPMDQPRQATRPTGFTPRFGPAAQEPPAAPRDEERAARPEQPARPAYGPERRPAYNEAPRFQPRPAYEARPAFEQPARPAPEARTAEQPVRPAYEPRPAYEARPAFEQPARPAPDAPARPAASEMLSPSECVDGSGILELHPDGYGFLRSESLLPSSRDVYVSAAQVRRFGLRTGDRVSGKNRPLRDGDKYSAMLYINEVNGAAVEGLISRPAFEELTAAYPSRRLALAGPDDVRLIDLLTPMGFGQRALVHCPPDCGKRRLLRNLANAIVSGNPDATVLLVLFNETPEDVTFLRDQVKCPVLATTFDMPPENHIRLADMVVDYAQRIAEQKRDVVLLVDSLSTLSRVCTTAALQQGRQTLGSVSPTSLQKAKHLFGAARSLREGGSLTIIATIHSETGSRVDDAINSEFRGTANLELVLDPALIKARVYPPVNVRFSGTKRVSLIASAEQQEGLKVVRSLLSDLPAETDVVPALLQMMEKTASNQELLSRIGDWAAALKK